MKLNLKATLGILGFSMLSVGVAVDSGVFNIGNLGLRLSRATGTSVVLNNSNAPTLVGGSDDRIDDKSITWEYRNCASYASGHVKINAGGYFGISSSSIYGYTGINNLSVSFTKGANGELWLLTSVDGINWSETDTLTSGTPTDNADNYRYIRFYNYDPDGNQINITSVSFEYTCEGTSATDDVDLAYYDNAYFGPNVTSNVDIDPETTTRSPAVNNDSKIAVRMTNTLVSTKNEDHIVDFKFDRQYSIAELRTKKIEFDYFHAQKRSQKAKGIPGVQLIQINKTTGAVTTKGNMHGSTESYDSAKSPFLKTDLDTDWWHLEYYICSLSGTGGDSNYDSGLPADGTMVDGIRINDKYMFDHDSISAYSIIDNLRICCTPSPRLGNWNRTAFTMNVGGHFWVKACWSGVLHKAELTFSDDTLAEHFDSTDSPFYIKATGAGTVVVHVKLTVGYNRQVLECDMATFTIS